MKELFRKIPKVDLLLEKPELKVLAATYGKKAVTEEIRKETDTLREEIKEQMVLASGMEPAEVASVKEMFLKRIEMLTDAVAENLVKDEPGFKRVINATGTILHTNLGRAPIAREHAEKMVDLVCGYSNLEYDLKAGHRGERYSHFEKLICQVTGAEAAMAVNNNAAAVLLVLSALGAGKEIIVSRGEQIEIGGKFRIPDVIRQGGAVLHEVGCTNKTHLDDYEDAINDNTGLFLKVHTSNYKVVGFSDSVSTNELAALSEKTKIPFVEDLGSGVLLDLTRYGMPKEPTVQEVIAAGADVVCFSGDKLLGGPQAGIIAGKKEFIAKIKKHPLTRAVRIDKFTAAAQEMVWREYYRLPHAELVKKIPVLKLMTSSVEEQKERAERILAAWKPYVSDRYDVKISEMKSQMGGGTLPLYQFDGAGIEVFPKTENAFSVEELEEKLRKLKTPVVARIQEGKLQLHMRTVFEEDIEVLAEAAQAIFG